MKKVLVLCLSVLFSSPLFASGIGANASSALCDNSTLETYGGTSNLEVDWQPNTINISWYEGDTKLSVQDAAKTCSYGGPLTLPSTKPTKKGYTFEGWTLRMPGTYTELEYLEITAFGPYIDTGINFNSNYTYEIDYSKGGLKNLIMGARNKCSASEKGNFSITYAINTCIYSSTSSRSVYSDFGDSAFGVKHKVKYQQSTRTLTVDGVNRWDSSWLTSIEIPHNVFLFAVNCENHASGFITNYARIHYYSVKNPDGTLIQNFIPARRDSDGVLGFYDSISGQFFTNAGTGNFIAGPAVE